MLAYQIRGVLRTWLYTARFLIVHQRRLKHIISQPTGMSEQMAHGDLLRRLPDQGLVGLFVEAIEEVRFRKFRQEASDILVEINQAPLHAL